MTTGVFSFCRRKQPCRINPDGPAGIRDARNSLYRDRFIARFIWSGAVTVCEAVPLPGDTMAAGRKHGPSS